MVEFILEYAWSQIQFLYIEHHMPKSSCELLSSTKTDSLLAYPYKDFIKLNHVFNNSNSRKIPLNSEIYIKNESRRDILFCSV